MIRNTLALALLGAAVSVGCGHDDYDVFPGEDDIVVNGDLASDVLDAARVDQSQLAIEYAMADVLFDDFFYDEALPDREQRRVATTEPPMSTDALAGRLASTASTYFVPQGCVSATSQGPTATIAFNRCDTSLGAVDISGTATATFARVLGAYAVHLAASALVLNGGVLDLEVDASGARSGGRRSLNATSTATFRGPNGTIERELGATVEWSRGSGCVTADGSGTTTLGGRAFYAELTGYRQCADQCPAAGTFTWTAGESELTLTLDGTSSPALVSADGTDRELDLTCEEPR